MNSEEWRAGIDAPRFFPGGFCYSLSPIRQSSTYVLTLTSKPDPHHQEDPLGSQAAANGFMSPEEPTAWARLIMSR